MVSMSQKCKSTSHGDGHLEALQHWNTHLEEDALSQPVLTVDKELRFLGLFFAT